MKKVIDWKNIESQNVQQEMTDFDQPYFIPIRVYFWEIVEFSFIYILIPARQTALLAFTNHEKSSFHGG